MKISFSALESLLLVLTFSFSSPIGCNGACPFGMSGANDEMMPQDEIHGEMNQKTGLRRRLAALSDTPDMEKLLMKIIDDRAEKHRSLQELCLTSSVYDAIGVDIAGIAGNLDVVSRAHFLGGIVRLAAHDFLDYDQASDSMGPDGCIDNDHDANAGLPQDIWCDTCDLTRVYEANYSFISKADFWVIAANSVILQTSVGAGLDLKTGFRWGRVDTDSCDGSADRLPEAGTCTEVKDVLITRLGLSWTDAVALIGAHTLGRGDTNFSGHHGIWVASDDESVVFDKKYYEEILRRAWVPRNNGLDNQDWTWGPPNGNSPRFMLNTDMCLLFNIDVDSGNYPCCSRTDLTRLDGSNQCNNPILQLENFPCSRYDVNDERVEAANAVEAFAFAGGTNLGNPNNLPFYNAFASAWEKATTKGWTNLSPLPDSCPSGPVGPTPSPTPNPTVFPSAAPSGAPVGSSSCEDESSFIDRRGFTRNCQWVQMRNKCDMEGRHCPVTCNLCGSFFP